MNIEKRNKELFWDILSTDYHSVDFKEYRETHNWTWLTKDRKVLWIENMDTDHILSCINMLERAGQEYTKAYEGLIEEIHRRYKDK